MDAEQLGRLRDILEAARLIASYLSNTIETAFRADRQKQDAVTGEEKSLAKLLRI